jgi:NTE family protein
MMDMKIGLALSGGGVRGMAHIGVIKALEELGVSVNSVSGTSAGALVGTLYAAGYTPDKIFDILKEVSMIKSARPAWAFTGLFTLDGLKELLSEYIPANTFHSLPLALTVTATDIRTGQARYFSEGELLPAVLASCTIPGIFTPLNFQGNLYVDGGLVDNLPVKPLRASCDFVIGSHCNHISHEFDIKNLKLVIERSLLIAINGNTQASRKLCDVFIEPPRMDRFSSLDISKAREIFEFSYEFTRQNFFPHHFQITQSA